MQSTLKPRAFIDLNAVKNNAKKVKSACKNAKLCAVVKSNAYGHGACEVANAIDKYCDYFAVATVSEGIALRFAGIVKPILCLLPDSDFLRASYYRLTLTVQSESDAQMLADFCLKSKSRIKFHLAVNSGMNRLGISTFSELLNIFNIIENSGADLDGVYSHFYNAKSDRTLQKQFKFFLPFVSAVKQKYKNAIAHISSSGALCKSDKYNLDMVRVGLLIYGYKPVNGTFSLKKAMIVKADCINKRQLKRGQNLLYGNYKVKRNTTAFILPYGYFNGLRTGLDGQLNNSCMNLCAVKKNGVIVSDAATTARRAKTNCYNVLTAFGNGCKRIYFYGEQNENNCR